MSELHPCEYCGTMLDENGEVESNIAACGPRMHHYASQCREYVHAAKESYKKQADGLAGLATHLQSELDTLRRELAEERARVVAWLYSDDARRYTEVGPLIAKAILEGRHVSGESTRKEAL